MVVFHRTSSLILSSFTKLKIFRANKPTFMSMSSDRQLVAVCQITATSDKEKNFQICKSLIDDAKQRGAKMVFLPECFDLVGENIKQSIQLSEPLNGPLITQYQKIASTQSLWLSLGGFHEKAPGDVSKIYNSHIIINAKGEISAVYRKCHLFDVSVPGGVQMKESDYVIPGNEIVNPVHTPVGKVGLGICYDMRFSELALCMAKAGAEILTYPSAFTVPTGMAHWESLLRARAIETQCYVIAAAQVGSHNPKRASYGHAMIIDPWGCIVACCSNTTGIATAEINLEYTKKVRESIPVWLHRRSDLYGDVISLPSAESTPEENYMFGSFKLLASQVFYKTQYSMAFVNKKPVLPGHVLISPIRCVKRMSDLSPIEVSDLFKCVQKVQTVMENEHGVSSSTISVQDGPDAGQTVPHVHVHILPRKPGDFKNNDDVYVQLECHDKGEEAMKNLRTDNDMIKEAGELRRHFSS